MKFLIIFTLILSVTFASPASSDGLNQEIAPQFEALRDVRFLVFTRFNPTIGQQVLFGDMNSLRASNYDANRPTRFVIHGFQSDSTSDVNIVITAAYLRSYDVNVIVVDWGLGANTINYITARNRVGEVGALVGQFCDFLHENNVLDFSRLYLIGSSLGAHIAGVSGKNIRRGRANTVIGLDPAGPLFNVNDPTTRVAPGDAEYVECIQTDSRNFGIGAAICDVDFFPNGGSNQPGCLSKNRKLKFSRNEN